MKKTNTKKSAPVKKAPSKVPAKKAPAPKVVASKTTKKTVVAQKAPAPKKAAPAVVKKAPVKKSVPAVAQKSTPATAMTSKDDIKNLGILHIVGNILSGGTLGIILVLLYLLFKKESISQLEKETCYEIINFNLSFLVYGFVAGGLIILVIGIILLPIVFVTWLVLLIKGFTEHLQGKNYKYPFIIRFVS